MRTIPKLKYNKIVIINSLGHLNRDMGLSCCAVKTLLGFAVYISSDTSRITRVYP